MNELYADGGVIKKNPSSIGGTYAYLILANFGTRIEGSGIVTPQKIGSDVTNNQTEMLALLTGLKRLPSVWEGTIYSDSNVSLGRLFRGWKWNNIPEWMQGFYLTQKERLIFWDKLEYVLLDGHPTKKQLASGFGKRGNPVSKHNVWCDLACTQAGLEYQEGRRDFPRIP